MKVNENFIFIKFLAVSMSLLYFKVSIASDMYYTCSSTYRLNICRSKTLIRNPRRDTQSVEIAMPKSKLAHKQGSCSNPGTSGLIVEFEDMAPGKKT